MRTGEMAGMMPARQAEIAARPVPECTTPGHGPMEPRDLTAQTYEQMWCGIWYDCQHPRCRSSVLIRNPELRDQTYACPECSGFGYRERDEGNDTCDLCGGGGLVAAAKLRGEAGCWPAER